MKKQLEDINVSSGDTRNVHFNFKDFEESVNVFSGDDQYSIQKWLEQFEESADIFHCDDKAKFVYAKRLLCGTAKMFLRTISVKTYIELKTALHNEFDRKITSTKKQ